jgi:nitrogen regulatory protein PII-like uncharacterized protein
MNREINNAMISPQKKFDTIFEEYVEKRKKFDKYKTAAKSAAVDEGGGGGGKNEVEILKNKITMIQKMAEVDLRHAKETAAKHAQELLEQKLAECKYVYEEELEFISKQFEDL